MNHILGISFFLRFHKIFLENCNRPLRIGFLRTVGLASLYRTISVTEKFLKNVRTRKDLDCFLDSLQGYDDFVNALLVSSNSLTRMSAKDATEHGCELASVTSCYQCLYIKHLRNHMSEAGVRKAIQVLFVRRF